MIAQNVVWSITSPSDGGACETKFIEKLGLKPPPSAGDFSGEFYPELFTRTK